MCEEVNLDPFIDYLTKKTVERLDPIIKQNIENNTARCFKKRKNK